MTMGMADGYDFNTAIGARDEVVCGKCGRHWRCDSNKQNMLNSGWERRWSWRKFRFIWVCLTCQV